MSETKNESNEYKIQIAKSGKNEKETTIRQ